MMTDVAVISDCSDPHQEKWKVVMEKVGKCENEKVRKGTPK